MVKHQQSVKKKKNIKQHIHLQCHQKLKIKIKEYPKKLLSCQQKYHLPMSQDHIKLYLRLERYFSTHNIQLSNVPVEWSERRIQGAHVRAAGISMALKMATDRAVN